jgi:hypothetical protein
MFLDFGGFPACILVDYGGNTYENWGRILGRNWEKSLNSFPPCYSQSSLLTDFTPPPLPPGQKWFETGKPKVWELSRLCPETSTKLYVHEFCFHIRTNIVYVPHNTYLLFSTAAFASFIPTFFSWTIHAPNNKKIRCWTLASIKNLLLIILHIQAISFVL